MKWSIVISLLLLASLLACTIPGTYYLLNKSDQIISVRLHYWRSYWLPGTQEPMLQGIIGDDNQPFRPKRSDKMDVLPFAVDSTTHMVTFELTPGHFALLGGAYNYHLMIDSAFITTQDTTVLILPEDRERWYFTNRGFPGYAGVLEFED